MTAYSNNIPQSTDRPSDSQPLLLSNFQALKVFLDRNHVPIVDPTTNVDEGKHKFLQMPEQGAAPTTAANEGGLYTKEASGITNLFWRQESDGTEVQLTNIAPSLALAGYTFLPGGLLLQWGVDTIAANPTTVTYPIAFSTVYQVVASLEIAPAGLTDRVNFNTANIGNSTFRLYINNPAAGLKGRWMAIGRKV